MNLFFDTSALVKFFHEEEGTDIVTDLILEQNNEVWISELGRLEFISAVFRRFCNKELDEGQLNTAIGSFENQIAGFNVEPLGMLFLSKLSFLLKNTEEHTDSKLWMHYISAPLVSYLKRIGLLWWLMTTFARLRKSLVLSL
jgi:hypothetical protein